MILIAVLVVCLILYRKRRARNRDIIAIFNESYKDECLGYVRKK